MSWALSFHTSDDLMDVNLSPLSAAYEKKTCGKTVETTEAWNAIFWIGNFLMATFSKNKSVDHGSGNSIFSKGNFQQKVV